MKWKIIMTIIMLIGMVKMLDAQIVKPTKTVPIEYSLEDNGILIKYSNGMNELCIGCEYNYINVSKDTKGNLIVNLFDNTCIIKPIIREAGIEVELGNMSSGFSNALNFKNEYERKPEGWYFNYTMSNINVDELYLQFYPEGKINGDKILCDKFIIDFSSAIKTQGFILKENSTNKINLIGDVSYIDPLIGYNYNNMTQDINVYNLSIGHNYGYFQFDLGGYFKNLKDKADFVGNFSLRRSAVVGAEDNDLMIGILYNQSVSLTNDNETSIWLQGSFNNTNVTFASGIGIKFFNITNQTIGLMDYLRTANYTGNPNMTIMISDPDYTGAKATSRASISATTIRTGNQTTVAASTWYSKEYTTSTYRPTLSIYFTDKININKPINYEWIYDNQTPYVNISTIDCHNYTWFEYKLFNGTIQNFTTGNGLYSTNNRTPLRFAQGALNITAYCNDSSGNLYSDTTNFYLYNLSMIYVEKDTYIEQNQPNDNFGNYSRIYVGIDASGRIQRGLFFANFTNYPNITIINFSFTAKISGVNSPGLYQEDLYKINTFWAEGKGITSGTINSITVNGTTWKENYNGSMWNIAGLGSGTDYNATILASLIHQQPSANYTWYINATLVQDWFYNLSLFEGVMLKKTDETSSTAFYSYESKESKPYGEIGNPAFFNFTFMMTTNGIEESPLPPVNSCTCITDGNWIINCADNCQISSECNMLSNSKLVFTGVGNVKVTADINGWKERRVEKGCKVHTVKS